MSQFNYKLGLTFIVQCVETDMRILRISKLEEILRTLKNV